MKRANLALVGYGPWGQKCARTIHGLQSVGIDLKFIISRHKAFTESGVHHLFPTIENRHDKSYWILPRLNGIDGVVIATPPHSHINLIEQVLEQNLCALVEKPISTDFDQLKLLASRFEDPSHLNSKIMVNHIHLFNSRFRKLLSLLPQIGEILSIETWGGSRGPFRNDYSALWDYGPHDVSMVLKILNDLPHKVTLNSLFQKKESEGHGANYDFSLIFENSCEVNIHVGTLFHDKKRLLIVRGSRGTLELDDTDPQHPLRLNQIPVFVPEKPSPLEQVVCEFAQLACAPDSINKQFWTPTYPFAWNVTKILQDIDHQSIQLSKEPFGSNQLA